MKQTSGMDLNGIWVFAKVVQAGSFSGAARTLGMPKSTVSHKVAELEQRLGVTLLQRTTRKLHLTEAGQAYFAHCARILKELEQAEAEAIESRADRVPRGLLRVTAPIEMGTGIMADAFSRFLRAYPEVELELVLTDRYLDLVADGIDVAVRAGPLDDSSLIARRIGVSRFQLFASAAHLKKHPAPQRPQDLDERCCLRFTSNPEDNVWELRNGERKASLQARGRFAANNLTALRELAAAGHGVALIPRYIASEDLRKGRLVQILPGWSSEDAPVHAVYPQSRFVPPKTRAFLEFISTELKGTL